MRLYISWVSSARWYSWNVKPHLVSSIKANMLFVANIWLCLNSLPYGKKFQTFLLSAVFFQNQLIWKILSGIPSECQTVWIQIRPNTLSGRIWVQTVCKGYQQTTLVGKELKTWRLKEKLLYPVVMHYLWFKSHVKHPVGFIQNNVSTAPQVCYTTYK